MAETIVKEPSYTGPSVRVSFSGFLFDMDGTIIDSTDAVVKHWQTVGSEIGVAPEVILETSHGRRSIDILRILAPEKANWEYVCAMEGRLPKLYGEDAVEIPGARALIGQLLASATQSAQIPPWTIVTSGTLPLVSGWLARLDLPKPAHLITAESVTNGKPDPACYRLGLEALHLTEAAPLPGEPAAGSAPSLAPVLVLEDSPAGIKAGKNAGCKVLGLVTSHTAAQVAAAEPDWIVKDLESVRVVEVREESDGRVTTTLEFSNLLVQ